MAQVVEIAPPWMPLSHADDPAWQASTIAYVVPCGRRDVGGFGLEVLAQLERAGYARGPASPFLSCQGNLLALRFERLRPGPTFVLVFARSDPGRAQVQVSEPALAGLFREALTEAVALNRATLVHSPPLRVYMARPLARETNRPEAQVRAEIARNNVRGLLRAVAEDRALPGFRAVLGGATHEEHAGLAQAARDHWRRLAPVWAGTRKSLQA